MADRGTETYEDWLERTRPAPNYRVSWNSWAGMAIGLLLIFAMNAVFLGCIVFATSAIEPITVFRRTTPERTKRRISILWTGVWVLGAVVELVRTDDHDWTWWTLLALVVVLVSLECRPQLRSLRGKSA